MKGIKSICLIVKWLVLTPLYLTIVFFTRDWWLGNELEDTLLMKYFVSWLNSVAEWVQMLADGLEEIFREIT